MRSLHNLFTLRKPSGIGVTKEAIDIVTCVRCGKKLAKECSCFVNDVERIKE